MSASTHSTTKQPIRSLANFIEGINPAVYLFLATVIAMIMANGSLQDFYTSLLGTELRLEVAGHKLLYAHGHEMTLQAFINDALMALFFFLVGLEIKHELVSGSLSSVRGALLPVIAAIGGMVMPVVLFMLVVDGGEAARGAAIPMATDIAFSLAVLGLLGNRVPKTVKVFLMALAVVDDIGGILVIALFYSGHINVVTLTIALTLVVIAFVLGRRGVSKPAVYYTLFVIVWFLFLHSGIHTTIAGVLIALAVPHQPRYGKQAAIAEVDELKRELSDELQRSGDRHLFLPRRLMHRMFHASTFLRKTFSPVRVIEHQIHGVVNYVILPLFAFANAGVTFGAMNTEMLMGVPLAIFLGLLVGKTIGIFSFTWIAAKARVVKFPVGMTTPNLLGISIFGGIGFTVSLFIANLAYSGAGAMAAELLNEAKIGVFAGTVASGLIGYFTLKAILHHEHKTGRGASSPEYFAYSNESEG